MNAVEGILSSMVRIFCVFRNGVLAGLTATLVGCAGSSLKRIEDGPGIPSELSQDLGQFEVVESKPEESPGQFSGQVSGTKNTPTSKGAVSSRPVLATGPQADRAANKVTSGGKKKNKFSYPMRRPPDDPIRVGERLVYEVSYLGMTAGEFDLSIQPFKQINNRKVYHVVGKARSSSVFSLFYKLNDTIETFIDYEGIFPHRFQLLLDESKQKRNSIELYDTEKQQTFYWSRWNHHKRGYSEVKQFFPLRPFSQDSLSGLYYIRTVPLNEGAVVSFPVISEGKNWDAVVTVLGRESVDTPMGRVRAVRLKLETKYQGILKKQEGGDNLIWLTDDDRRFLVRLEAKIKIGSIIGKLKQIEPGVSAPKTAEVMQTKLTPGPALRDEVLPPAGVRAAQ